MGPGRATTRAHSPHPLPARPYDTTKRPNGPVYRRGGGGAELGGDPCGRPSDVYDHASSPYLKWISPCACPRGSALPPVPTDSGGSHSLFGRQTSLGTDLALARLPLTF